MRLQHGLNYEGMLMELDEEQKGQSVTEALAEYMNYNFNTPSENSLGWAWNEAEAKACREGEDLDERSGS